ncbi:MAG: lysine biosynthesis protein LysX [Planctomycetota bacterium]
MIALLYARIRPEERLIAEAMAARSIEHELVDVRTLVYDPESLGDLARFDVVFDRCLSLTQAAVALEILGGLGVRTVNPIDTVRVCSDKLATTVALARAGIAQPRCRVATDADAALRAVEEIGYPCVLKPTVGSWGRLLARLNDRDAAEAVIEHKATLGSVAHSVFYIQEFIDKPGRDLRIFTVGGRAIAGIERRAEHWVTNTARGAEAAGITVTDEIRDISERAAAAMGGDIVAVDLLEDPERGHLVCECNHTMEFRNSIAATGVDIPGLMVEHVAEVMERARAKNEASRGRTPADHPANPREVAP